MAVHRPQRLARAVEQADQLLVGQAGEVGDLGEHVVDLFDQVARQAGKRGAQPADRHATLRRRTGGRGSMRAKQRARTGRLLDAEQLQVGGDVAVDVDDDRRRGELLRGRACSLMRSTSRIASRHRLHPEVELERRQRVRERLGNRTGTEHRTGGVGVVPGRGDRPALEHDDVVVDDRPLDVLRTAEHVGRALLQRHEPAHVGDRRRRSNRVDSTTLPRAVSVIVTPSTSPLTSWSGPPGTAAIDEAVGATGDGVGAEHDAAGVGNEERLDEHGHAARDRQTFVHGFATRDDRAHGVDETVPAAHVEHGLEAAGHRRVDAVLDRRRRAHDERAGCRSR